MGLYDLSNQVDPNIGFQAAVVIVVLVIVIVLMNHLPPPDRGVLV